MRGYACANCGGKPDEKLKPPTTAKKICPECGKSLMVKMSDTETMVVTKVASPLCKRRRKPETT